MYIVCSFTFQQKKPNHNPSLTSSFSQSIQSRILSINKTKQTTPFTTNIIMIISIVHIIVYILWRVNCQSRVSCTSTPGSLTTNVLTVSTAECGDGELLTSCGYETQDIGSIAPTVVNGVFPTFNDITDKWECIGERESNYEIKAYANCCQINGDINQEITCRELSTTDIVTPAPNTANGDVTAVCDLDEELTDCTYSDLNDDSMGAIPKYFDTNNDQCIATSPSGTSIPQGRCCDLRGAAQLTCNSFQFTSAGSASIECDIFDSEYVMVGCSAIGNGSPILDRYIDTVFCNARTTAGDDVTAVALWYAFIFYYRKKDI